MNILEKINVYKLLEHIKLLFKDEPKFLEDLKRAIKGEEIASEKQAIDNLFSGIHL